MRGCGTLSSGYVLPVLSSSSVVKPILHGLKLRSYTDSLKSSSKIFGLRISNVQGSLINVSHKAKLCIFARDEHEKESNNEELVEETGLTLFPGRSVSLQVLRSQPAPALAPWQDSVRRSADGNSLPAPPLKFLGKEEAMGIVLCAAMGTGWTTGSGLEGPSVKQGAADSDNKLWPPLLSKSPRRTRTVEFTCNKCGTRTARAINPHAYSEGTVFVQCQGCDVFHKLVDHLGLFHELKGPVYHGYGISSFGGHEPFDPLGVDMDGGISLF